MYFFALFPMFVYLPIFFYKMFTDVFLNKPIKCSYYYEKDKPYLVYKYNENKDANLKLMIDIISSNNFKIITNICTTEFIQFDMSYLQFKLPESAHVSHTSCEHNFDILMKNDNVVFTPIDLSKETYDTSSDDDDHTDNDNHTNDDTYKNDDDHTDNDDHTNDELKAQKRAVEDKLTQYYKRLIDEKMYDKFNESAAMVLERLDGLQDICNNIMDVKQGKNDWCNDDTYKDGDDDHTNDDTYKNDDKDGDDDHTNDGGPIDESDNRNDLTKQEVSKN